jgi:hypothetical protein
MNGEPTVNQYFVVVLGQFVESTKKSTFLQTQSSNLILEHPLFCFDL